MTMRYEDILEEAIAAIRNGEDLERVLARVPEHADALRDDLRLAAAVRNYAGAIAPSATARTDANQRLMSTLQAERTAHPSGSPSPSTGRGLGGGGLPRFAMAAAVVLVAFVALATLDRDNGPTVEAATIEGVVLGNTEGSLTVQTLDALEQVTVPSDAAVSDAAGASIELASHRARRSRCHPGTASRRLGRSPSGCAPRRQHRNLVQRRVRPLRSTHGPSARPRRGLRRAGRSPAALPCGRSTNYACGPPRLPDSKG